MLSNKTHQEGEENKILNVLLVEDEPAAREASEQFLARSGCNVRAAANAREALCLARESVPDVLVCDWHLGGGRTGVDVARELKSESNLKIILVSAHPLDQLREASNDFEVIRYLRKPISLRVLAGTIEKIRISAE